MNRRPAEPYLRDRGITPYYPIASRLALFGSKPYFMPVDANFSNQSYCAIINNTIGGILEERVAG